MADEATEDAAHWRDRLATLPPRDVWRIVQADVALSQRILAGFRPGADALRRSAVIARLADAVVRDPRLAASLRGIPPEEPSPRPAPPSPSPPEHPEIPRLRAKIDELRRALREKDVRLAARDAEALTLRKERDTARAEAEREREARRTSEERLQRLRTAATAAPAEKAPPRPPRPRGTDLPIAAPPSLALDEALRRLLHHRKYGAVAAVCQELLAEPETTIAEKGAIHSAFASALSALGEDDRAVEQETLATDALLDAGRSGEAAEKFAQRLAAPGATPRPDDGRRLIRLLTLAVRDNQIETVRNAFLRLRVLAPESYPWLEQTLARAGGPQTALREALATAPTWTVGPDQVIALPTTHKAAASVTPRRLARAVDAGEEALVAAARDGIAALRRNQEELARATLEAIGALSTEALYPLAAPSRSAIVVDAANVAHHQSDPLAHLVANPPASVANLATMRAFLLRRGYFPVLFLADASLRYRVDRSDAYAELLRRQMIRETPPGTTADEALLIEARHRGVPLVSNDRMGEWESLAEGVERFAFDLFADGRVTLSRRR